MEDLPYQWYPYEDRFGRGFLDQPALKCYLGKLFYFHYGRNAWNWTWTTKYPGAAAFHPTIESCQAEIEGRRVQGSTWRIRELPAVVVEGSEQALLITEINTDRPLHEFTAPVIANVTTLVGIAESFIPLSQNSVIRFIADPELVGPTRLPLQGMKSYPAGPKDRYYLGWQVESVQQHIDAALDVVREISVRLQER